MKTILSHLFAPVLRVALSAALIFALLAGCSTAQTGAVTATTAPIVSEVPTVEPTTTTKTTAATPATATEIARETALPLASTLPDTSAFAILFVNVGKADAAILRLGETTVLIDTGSAESAPQLIAGLNALGVSAIDAVFITHSHSDHLGGLDALAANYPISVVYSPFYSEADKNGTGKIVKRAEKLGLDHRELKAGESIAVSKDVSFSVLGPVVLNDENDNDNSLVLRFSYGGKTFLFAGDMQFSEEKTLIAAGAALKSDVLKVGNHGNPDATGDDFGALVSPALAIISTNTAVDMDSANPRVLAALPLATTYVTQDFPIGALMTLDANGQIAISNPAREPANTDVVISDINVTQQTVTLVNHGSSSVDLSGYVLFSLQTDAALRFAEGTMLDPGETLVVGSGALSFPNEDKPLSKKKKNTVSLYNHCGSLVSELTR